MPICKAGKKAMAIALSTASILSMSGMNVVFANETEEYAKFESFEETATSTSMQLLIDDQSSVQLRPIDDFDLSSVITIKGATYKSLIQNEIDKLQRQNNDIKENVTLKGLDSLTGTLQCSISIPYKLNNSNIKVNFETNANGGIVTVSPPAVNNQSDKCDITIDLTIDWGKFMSTKLPEQTLSNLRLFSLEDFPDLEIELTAPNLKFDISDENKDHRPQITDQKSITGSVKSCTLTTKPSGNISITYTPAKNGYYDKQDPVKLTSESISQNITVSTLTNPTMNIVEKRTHSSGSKPTNRPGTNNPSSPSEADELYVIRLYNPNSGEHFFTTSEAERINLVSLGWKVERCDWSIPGKSNSPIYRLYNPNNGDHHYTTNAGEKDTLVQLGWNYEGHPLYSAEEDDGIPIYRMYNPNEKGAGSHHYTESLDECNALKSYGWNFEGIAWYGLSK